MMNFVQAHNPPSNLEKVPMYKSKLMNYYRSLLHYQVIGGIEPVKPNPEDYWFYEKEEESQNFYRYHNVSNDEITFKKEEKELSYAEYLTDTVSSGVQGVKNGAVVISNQFEKYEVGKGIVTAGSYAVEGVKTVGSTVYGAAALVLVAF